MEIRNITEIKPNPANPRIIKDDRFKKLVKSLAEFPDMLNKRPLVCVTDTDGLIFPLGGNMRLLAANELKMPTLPVEMADDWNAEQRREFIIKDNVGFGEWNWEELQQDWDVEQLENWGLDVPKQWEAESEIEPSGYEQTSQWFLNIRCENEEETQKLYERFIEEGLDVKIVT